MGRVRTWPARTAAEVYIRLALLDQPVAHVARATNLTYQQVSFFAKELQANPNSVPPCSFPNEKEFNELREELEATAKDELALSPARRSTPLDLSEQQHLDLDNEIVGCIALVRQAAAQFGISPRNFLHRCITHAQSL